MIGFTWGLPFRPKNSPRDTGSNPYSYFRTSAATTHVLHPFLVLPHLGRNAQLIDVGSGAGLPAIPCFVANTRLHGPLIDSSKRKAVFLTEDLHHLDLSRRAQGVADRFEKTVVASADVVTCRAIDQFTAVLPELIDWG